MGPMQYLILGLLVALAVVTGGAYWQYQVAQGRLEEIATLKGNLSVATQEIKGLNDNIKALDQLRAVDQKLSNALSEKVNALTEDRDGAIKRLNSFRDRLDAVALKNPTAVGTRASSATIRVMREFYEASGGRASDGPGPVLPPAAPAPDKPVVPAK